MTVLMLWLCLADSCIIHEEPLGDVQGIACVTAMPHVAERLTTTRYPGYSVGRFKCVRGIRA